MGRALCPTSGREARTTSRFCPTPTRRTGRSLTRQPVQPCRDWSGDGRHRHRLIPLYACEILERNVIDSLPGFSKRLRWFLENRTDLAQLIRPSAA